MTPLFSISFLEKELYKYLVPNPNEKKKIVETWCESIEKAKKNETAIKSSFVNKVFNELLGYSRFGDSKIYHFEEEKGIKGAGQADFILGHFNGGYNIEVVGELKSLYADLDKPQTSRKDLNSPVAQGLDYLHSLPESARFMIASNMNEIRLYKRGIKNRFESFYFIPPDDKKSLLDEIELRKFFYLLSKSHLLTIDNECKTEKLFSIQGEEEKKIEKKFYSEYKGLRENLFFDILKHNPSYENNKSHLLALTQKFIDRIIFCWFCEDSREQLLPTDILLRLIEKETNSDFYDKNGTSVYHQVKHLFNAINVGNPVFKIEKGYNGGLFQEDKKLDKLMIPNYLFETIKDLSGYDFGNDEILNVNILGHIFEQSISDLEEMKAHFDGQDYDKKKGKRKKEGVYYTPDYITKYIVEQAVGGWLKDRLNELKEKHKDALPNFTLKKNRTTQDRIIKFKEKDTKWQKDKDYKNAILEIQKFVDLKNTIIENLTKIEKEELTKLMEVLKEIEDNRNLIIYEDYRKKLEQIKVLDPACGSGAFLVQAFTFLFDENKETIRILRALNPQTEAWDNDKFVKSILQNNLYGVDLNSESVEITKLSLWLQTAEKDKKLADLDKNIRCGNSLIDDPTIAGDKAFVWEMEFKPIMKGGGFDVVIGNPPYVHAGHLDNKDLLIKKYESGNSSADIYVYFYEKGYQLLTEKGYLGFITSNSFMRSSYGKDLRIFLSTKTTPLNVFNFGDNQFFEGVATRPVIVILKKVLELKTKTLFFELEGNHIIIPSEFNNYINKEAFEVDLINTTKPVWSFLKSQYGEKVIEKMRKAGIKFSKYIEGKVYYGIKTGFNEAFVINRETKNRLIKSDSKSANIIKPWLRGRDIHRWYFDFEEQYLIATGYDVDILNMYPAIYEYLKQFQDKLEKRSDQGVNWYNLRACAYYEIIEKPKIIYAEMTNIPSFLIDYSGAYIDTTCFIIPSNDLFLTALLNSKLMFFYFQNDLAQILGGTLRFKYKDHMEHIPIVNNPNNGQLEAIGKQQTEQSQELVKQRNDFLSWLENTFQPKKISQKLKNPYKLNEADFFDELKKQKVNPDRKQYSDLKEGWQELKTLYDKINETDREIDEMVFDLYGLTAEERKIVLESV